MTAVRWLVRTGRTKRTIITAPDAPVGVGAATERLEAALDGYAGVTPAWFRPLERLGYRWYAICMAATAAVFAFAAPNGLAVNLAYGLGAGIAAAVVSGAVVTSAARLQTRLTRGRAAEAVIEEVDPLARPGDDVADRVEAILARDPAREREVHELAWRAAGDDPHRQAADDELDALWQRADPEAAAAHEARIRELKERLAEIRAKSKR